MKNEFSGSVAGAETSQQMFHGSGEMYELMRSKDWSQTPVGPVSSWPQSLKVTVNMILNSRFGMFLWWGPDLVQFYNDAYRPSFGYHGEKHPVALGQNGKECWQEIWPIIHPQIEQVMTDGIATWNENQLVPIYRNGILEEVYWTYSYSPVFNDDGKVGGVLVVVSETTKQVIGERRTNLLREVATLLNVVTKRHSLYETIPKILQEGYNDIPFSLFYTFNEEAGNLELQFKTAWKGSFPVDLQQVSITGPEDTNSLLRRAMQSENPFRIDLSDQTKSFFPGENLPEHCTSAFILPVYGHNTKQPYGIFIAGISPRQIFDKDYADFLISLTRQIAHGLKAILDYEHDLRRQQEISIARNEAEASHKRLYDLFMHAPAVIAVFSGPELKFEIANPLYRQLVGIQRPLDGKPLFEAIPDLEPELVKIIKNVATKGKRFMAKELPVTLDWEQNGNVYTKYLELLYEPLFEVGKPNGFTAFAYDITEHVKARKRIQEQNDLLKLLTEGATLEEALHYLVLSIEKQSENNIKGSVLLLDEDGIHLRHGAAPSLSAEYNQAIDGISLGAGSEFDGPPDYLRRSLMISDIGNHPWWQNYKDLAAQEKLGACLSVPILSSSKEALGVLAIYYEHPGELDEHDKQIIDFATRTASLVIEKKHAEKALQKITDDLQQQKRMYDSVISSTPDFVYIIDTNYQFTFVNESLLAMWGKTLEESIGKRFIELDYEPWHAQMHEDEIDQVIATRLPFRGSVAFPHATLGERMYDYIFAPILGRDGEVIAIAGTTRDISEIKNLENQKDQFIAIASHELKTPITSLKAYTQLLQLRFQKQSDLMAADFMKKMDLQINKLTNLINDLLDVTKMQDGKMQFTLQTFPVNELIIEITEEVQRTSTSHSLNLQLGQNVSVFADRDRIGQVLINYLTNAIKYSPHESVVNITSEVKDGFVTVKVKDFGLGIPEDKKEKVFERFYRVEGEKQQTFAGLGIGLFISKEIISRHDGKVWTESNKGKGSAFYFSLPVKNAKGE